MLSSTNKITVPGDGLAVVLGVVLDGVDTGFINAVRLSIGLGVDIIAATSDCVSALEIRGGDCNPDIEIDIDDENDGGAPFGRGMGIGEITGAEPDGGFPSSLVRWEPFNRSPPHPSALLGSSRHSTTS
jgi:hypothetical protein